MVHGFLLAVALLFAMSSSAWAHARSLSQDHIVRVDHNRPDCDPYWLDNVSAARFEADIYPHFTLCYARGFEHDAEVVEKAVRRMLRLARIKYGLSRPVHYQTGNHHRTIVYLWPGPNGAIPGTSYNAFNACCIEKGGKTIAEIHGLTPSLHTDVHLAPACYPNNDEFGAQQYSHEMFHTIQRAWAWNYRVEWELIEGLAEYEGFVEGTPWARTTGLTNLLEARRRPPADSQTYYARALDGSRRIRTTDVYNTGVALMLFYAETYGDDIHLQYLSRGTPRNTQWREFVAFRRWLDTQPGRPGCRPYLQGY